MTNIVKSNTNTNVSKAEVAPKIANSKIHGVGVDTTRFKYNQSPVETPDGVIVAFTLPNSDSFVSGLIEVFVNGNQKIKDTEWEETGLTQITFIGSLSTDPPTSSEIVKFNYIKK